MTLKISRSQVSTQPNPTHQKFKKNWPNPTQPNPWMHPTHDQLWLTAVTLSAPLTRYLLAIPKFFLFYRSGVSDSESLLYSWTSTGVFHICCFVRPTNFTRRTLLRYVQLMSSQFRLWSDCMSSATFLQPILTAITFRQYFAPSGTQAVCVKIL